MMKNSIIMDPIHQNFANKRDGFNYDDFYPAHNYPNGYVSGDHQSYILQEPQFLNDQNHTLQNFVNQNNLTHNLFNWNNPTRNFSNQNNFVGHNSPMLNFSNQSNSIENPCISSGLEVPRVNRAISTATNAKEGIPDDSEIFSDANLNYISQMLSEEDIDEKVNVCHEQAAISAAVKPFYDILNENYMTSPDQPPYDSGLGFDSPEDNKYGGSFSCGSNGGVVDTVWPNDSLEYVLPQVVPVASGLSSLTSVRSSSISSDYSSKSSFSSPAVNLDYSSKPLSGNVNVIGNAAEEADQQTSFTGTPSMFMDIQSSWQFRKGLEEAQKFLPSDQKLVVDVDAIGFSVPQASKVELRSVEVKPEKEEQEYAVYGSKGRKNRYYEDLDSQEGRGGKQTAVSFENVTLRSEMFDSVLLCRKGRGEGVGEALRKELKEEMIKNSQTVQSKSNVGKARGQKQTKKEVVDLRTLLTHCAQAVAADDRRSAYELLNKIRQHCSAFGDGSQRLAQCLADGLEARLAGTGSQIYKSVLAKRPTATDVLKAYQLYLAACPFKRVSHFFASQAIMSVTENASRVHIVDFGIYFGFQWPALIQRISGREGGPPKLRITGIDVPQPGFRPTERIEETGRRLEEYAQGFNVPFEYNSISSKWEDIRVEHLKIEKDEVLIVNCLYRFRNLVDETVVVDSPRNKVLNTIGKMNPNIFIHGIVNGSYSAPFFVTRFREALFHYSALFDMLENNVPREDPQRMLIERDLFGREAMNVIACEGSERVERPETYKQWQVRNLRAGFKQLPLDPATVAIIREKVKSVYHKDFVVDEDSRWLLQGWKGRIIYAISTWKPNSN